VATVYTECRARSGTEAAEWGQADSEAETAEGSVVEDAESSDDDEWEDEAFVINSANVTAWSSGQRLLEVATADVWLIQESRHEDDDAVRQATKWAKDQGLKLAAGRSLRGKEKARAGADVAALHKYTQSRWPGCESTEIWPGRCTGVKLSCLARGGLAVASVYGEVGTGLKGNTDLLDELEAKIALLDCLWVVGGDFNLPPPKALEEFAKRTGGVVVATERPTCDAGKDGSVIDYFIVHAELQHLVKVRLFDDGLIRTHKVVSLAINSKVRELLQLEACEFKRFAVDEPIGCRRQECAPMAPGEDATLDERAELWYASAEEELMRVFDLIPDGPEGAAELEGYCGRGRPAAYARRPVVSPRKTDFPRSTPASRAAREIAARCADIARALDQGKEEQARRTRVSLAKKRGALVKSGAPPVWRSRLRGGAWPAETWREWCTESRVLAERLEEQQLNENAGAWRCIAQGACTGGAGLGHRLSKVLPAWEADEPDEDLDDVCDPYQLLISPEDGIAPAGRGPDARVEHELRKWEPLWRAKASAEEAGAVEWPDDLGPQLPKADPARIRAVARTFKRPTGLGPDRFHPRWVALLSDVLLEQLAAIFEDSEAAGRWPEVFEEVFAVFIPKADGGLRPILLYATPYRIWAKLRLPIVNEWEAKPHVDQDFWWGGRGRAVEKCTWEQAALKELSLLSNVAGATVAADLHKFYEHIEHEKLIVEAQAVGYPLRLLRMNIRVCRGRRRCRIGRACSRPVYATRSVGAGCSHAQGISRPSPCEPSRPCGRITPRPGSVRSSTMCRRSSSGEAPLYGRGS